VYRHVRSKGSDLGGKTVANFFNACKGANLDAAEVAKHAEVLDVNNITLADLNRLRGSFKEMISQ